MKADIKTKIQQIILRQPHSESETAHLMVLVRKYLDQLEDNNFFTLRFFCDWSVHSEIERSLPAMELLKQLNAKIVELKDTPDNDLLRIETTEIVSFKKLKEELNRFFEEIGIEDNYTIDEEKWKIFVVSFVDIISDCPLILSDPRKYKKAKEIYDEIVANPIGKGAHVSGLAISYVNDSIFKGDKNLSTGATLCLVLLLSDTTRIVIPLTREFLS